MSNNRIKVVRATTNTLPVNAPLGELVFDTERSELWVGMGEDTPLKQITDSKVINLEKIFDSLIINAGNSNAEIVDARTDYHGITYPTLKKRLNELDKSFYKLTGGIPNLPATIQEAKATNEELKVTTSLANNKNIELKDSISKAQDFIGSLDESHNIPQLRQDVTALQNGLKQNQSLEYKGTNVVAHNTLEGRTKNLKIVGTTLKNEISLFNMNQQYYRFIPTGDIVCMNGDSRTWDTMENLCDGLEPDVDYTLFVKNIGENDATLQYLATAREDALTPHTEDLPIGKEYRGVIRFDQSKRFSLKCFAYNKPVAFKVMLIKGNIPYVTEYFMGMKSTGDQPHPLKEGLVIAPNENDVNREWNQSTGEGKIKTSRTPFLFRVPKDRIKSHTKYTIVFIGWSEGEGSSSALDVGESNFFEGQTTCTLPPKEMGTLWKLPVTTGDLSQLSYLEFYLRSRDNSKILCFSNVLFVEGDVRDQYVYMPPEINTLPKYADVTNPNSMKCKISTISHGKNLFNYKTMYSSWWINAYGVLYKDDSATKYSLLVPLNNLNPLYLITPNKDRCTVGFLDENNKVLSYHTLSAYDMKVSTPTPPVGTRKALIYLRTTGYDTSTDNNIMVSYTDSSFEPYTEDKKDIFISQPLCTGTYIYEKEGKVKVQRPKGKYTFTGEEGWTLGTQSQGWGEFEDSLIFYLDPFPQAKVNTEFICNWFTYNTNVVSNNVVGIYNNIWGGKPHPVIRVKKSMLPTPNLEGFKQLLAMMQVTIIYDLATPEIEIVEGTNDLDVDTMEGTTYLSNTNFPQASIEFSVSTNLGSLIQEQGRDINDLYDIIKEVVMPSIMSLGTKLASTIINNGLR